MKHITNWCTDCAHSSTFTQKKGTQWYAPSLFGASTIATALYDMSTYAGVLDVLERLEQDDYAIFLRRFLQMGMARFGNNWRYADICTVLYTLARMFCVQDYLEIGVRRGRSLAMVIDQRPTANAVGFDLWMQNYAGMDNPGPDYVRNEMSHLGHIGQLVFVSGDSAQTLPDYFSKNPNATFDLITVDGDHSPEGAIRDLVAVLPRLRIGGALVFDDISHPEHKYLYDIWLRTVQKHPNMSCYAFTEVGYGVAFAIRMY